MSRNDTIIESLTKRIEARERGEKTGYGDLRSLEIEISDRAKPFLATWRPVEEEAPEHLDAQTVEELAAIRALLNRAKRVMPQEET